MVDLASLIATPNNRLSDFEIERNRAEFFRIVKKNNRREKRNNLSSPIHYYFSCFDLHPKGETIKKTNVTGLETIFFRSTLILKTVYMS